MKVALRILLSVFLLSASASFAQGTDVVAKASLDSVYILMGKQTSLHIEVVGNLDPSGGINTVDSMWKDVEIVSIGEPAIEDLGNNRKELKQDIIVQSFDSGMYTLPPVYYVQEGIKVATNQPVLKVVPVPVDSMATIHDFADISDVDRHFFDIFPDWMTDYGVWILLSLAVIGLALFIYFKWLRKGKIPLVPTKKPVPPYQLALLHLDALRNEHLCERGEEREFYTRLTDILRVYIDKRFGINAMEMTTTQIKRALKDNEFTRISERHMAKILEIADFVKFAKVRPLPDDNEKAFRSAVQFVEETRPVETTDESKSTESTEQNN